MSNKIKKILLIFATFILGISNANAAYLNENGYADLKIRRSYIVGSYIFDLSKHNPTLKDLMLAAQTQDQGNVYIYEMIIAEDINGNETRKYKELLENKVLSEFPTLIVDYIYIDEVGTEDGEETKIALNEMQKINAKPVVDTSLARFEYSDIISEEYIYKPNISIDNLLEAAGINEDEVISITTEFYKKENDEYEYFAGNDDGELSLEVGQSEDLSVRLVINVYPGLSEMFEADDESLEALDTEENFELSIEKLFEYILALSGLDESKIVEYTSDYSDMFEIKAPKKPIGLGITLGEYDIDTNKYEIQINKDFECDVNTDTGVCTTEGEDGDTYAAFDLNVTTGGEIINNFEGKKFNEMPILVDVDPESEIETTITIYDNVEDPTVEITYTTNAFETPVAPLVLTNSELTWNNDDKVYETTLNILNIYEHYGDVDYSDYTWEVIKNDATDLEGNLSDLEDGIKITLSKSTETKLIVKVYDDESNVTSTNELTIETEKAPITFVTDKKLTWEPYEFGYLVVVGLDNLEEHYDAETMENLLVYGLSTPANVSENFEVMISPNSTIKLEATISNSDDVNDFIESDIEITAPAAPLWLYDLNRFNFNENMLFESGDCDVEWDSVKGQYKATIGIHNVSEHYGDEDYTNYIWKLYDKDTETTIRTENDVKLNETIEIYLDPKETKTLVAKVYEDAAPYVETNEIVVTAPVAPLEFNSNVSNYTAEGKYELNIYIKNLEEHFEKELSEFANDYRWELYSGETLLDDSMNTMDSGALIELEPNEEITLEAKIFDQDGECVERFTSTIKAPTVPLLLNETNTEWNTDHTVYHTSLSIDPETFQSHYNEGLEDLKNNYQWSLYVAEGSGLTLVSTKETVIAELNGEDINNAIFTSTAVELEPNETKTYVAILKNKVTQVISETLRYTITAPNNVITLTYTDPEWIDGSEYYRVALELEGVADYYLSNYNDYMWEVCWDGGCVHDFATPVNVQEILYTRIPANTTRTITAKILDDESNPTEVNNSVIIDVPNVPLFLVEDSSLLSVNDNITQFFWNDEHNGYGIDISLPLDIIKIHYELDDDADLENYEWNLCIKDGSCFGYKAMDFHQTVYLNAETTQTYIGKIRNKATMNEDVTNEFTISTPSRLTLDVSDAMPAIGGGVWMRPYISLNYTKLEEHFGENFLLNSSLKWDLYTVGEDDELTLVASDVNLSNNVEVNVEGGETIKYKAKVKNTSSGAYEYTLENEHTFPVIENTSGIPMP